MSLSSSELSTIQQAGLALHRAGKSVSQALRVYAQRLVDDVANRPLEPNGEQEFARLKQMAGLSKELAGMEERLKVLYSDAEQLQAPKKRHRTVVGKPAAKGRSNGRSRRQADSLEPRPPRPLSPNDLRVLNYMKSVLKTTEWTPLTGSIVAAGTGLPKGSVGISITRVLASGAVRRGEGGTYQLVA